MIELSDAILCSFCNRSGTDTVVGVDGRAAICVDCVLLAINAITRAHPELLQTQISKAVLDEPSPMYEEDDPPDIIPDEPVKYFGVSDVSFASATETTAEPTGMEIAQREADEAASDNDPRDQVWGADKCKIKGQP